MRLTKIACLIRNLRNLRSSLAKRFIAATLLVHSRSGMRSYGGA